MQDDLAAFVTMCDQLGVPLAAGKTYGPAAAIQFLGITLDAVHMEARLPEDKLTKARDLLVSFRDRQKVTLRELQALVGFLNFACSVIVPGRPFLRRLIDLTRGVPKPHHHIRLTRQTKLDLGLWLDFLLQVFLFEGRFLDWRLFRTVHGCSRWYWLWRAVRRRVVLWFVAFGVAFIEHFCVGIISHYGRSTHLG